MEGGVEGVKWGRGGKKKETVKGGGRDGMTTGRK